MRTHPAPFVIVVFDCNHKRSFERARCPQPGDEMICVSCRKPVTVTDVVEEYRVRCSNCTFSRPYGQNRVQAEIVGSKHHNRYPHHEVKLFLGTKQVHIWRPNPDGLFTKILHGKNVEDLALPPF